MNNTQLITIAAEEWAEGLTVQQACFIEAMYAPESPTAGDLAESFLAAGYESPGDRNQNVYNLVRKLAKKEAIDKFQMMISERRKLTRPLLSDMALTQYYNSVRNGDRTNALKSIELMARLNGHWQEHLIIDSAKQFAIDQSLQAESKRLANVLLKDSIDADFEETENPEDSEPEETTEPPAEKTERSAAWFLSDD